jgi:hypothetical protein
MTGSSTSANVSRRAGGGQPPERRARLALRNKRFLLAVGALVLAGVVAFAVVHNVTTGRFATSVSTQPASRPPRPPLTRAEEAYSQALWPIHGAVERSAVRMSLGQIFYKIHDMDRGELKTRVDDAMATYRQAEMRLRELRPPPSLERAHADYLAAVQLFQKSALEVLKMFDDGSDDHLLAAYPLSLEGSNKIRVVGAQFWPGEFPPN